MSRAEEQSVLPFDDDINQTIRSATSGGCGEATTQPFRPTTTTKKCQQNIDCYCLIHAAHSHCVTNYPFMYWKSQ